MIEPAHQQYATGETELVERARRKDHVAIRLTIKQQNQRLYRIARSGWRRPSPYCALSWWARRILC
jgi:hypothetical protein